MGQITEDFLARRGYTTPAPDGFICALEAEINCGMPRDVFYKLFACLAREDVAHVGRTPLARETAIRALADERRRRLARKRERQSRADVPIDLETETLHDDGGFRSFAQAYLEYDELRRQRVWSRAARELPDGRIAVDLGLLLG